MKKILRQIRSEAAGAFMATFLPFQAWRASILCAYARGGWPHEVGQMFVIACARWPSLSRWWIDQFARNNRERFYVRGLAA